jgi:hypothetical protein
VTVTFEKPLEGANVEFWTGNSMKALNQFPARERVPLGIVRVRSWRKGYQEFAQGAALTKDNRRVTIAIIMKEDQPFDLFGLPASAPVPTLTGLRLRSSPRRGRPGARLLSRGIVSTGGGNGIVVDVTGTVWNYRLQTMKDPPTYMEVGRISAQSLAEVSRLFPAVAAGTLSDVGEGCYDCGTSSLNIFVRGREVLVASQDHRTERIQGAEADKVILWAAALNRAVPGLPFPPPSPDLRKKLLERL